MSVREWGRHARGKGAIWLVALATSVSCAGGGPAPAAPPPASSSGAFAPRSIEKVAVVFDVIRDRRMKESTQRLVEDEFIGSMLRKGYGVASRSDIDAVLKELRLQASGFTDKDAAGLGKLLNVPVVLLVTVTQWKTEPYRGYRSGGHYVYFDTTASISARLVSVEKGEVLWLGKHGGTHRTRDRDGIDVLVVVTKQVAESFPGRS